MVLVEMACDLGAVPVQNLVAFGDAALMEPPPEVVIVLPLVLGDAAWQSLQAIVGPEVQTIG